MHANFIDPFHAQDSLLHHVAPRVKLVLAVAFILTAALLPPAAWPGYILLFALILAVAILSELGPLFAIKRAFLVIPFALAALPVLFTTPGEPWLHFPVGRWALTITGAGLARFLSIAIKSWLSMQAGILLAASTPFPQLLMAMRALRVPRLLVGVFGLMWRYLFVLADEALRLLRARDARSAALAGAGGSSVIWRAKVTGYMAGSLFLRGYERSERIYEAMLARGYDGEVRTLPLAPLAPSEKAALLVGLAVLGSVLALEVWVW
jgi:cobalt/nickel transport system permease protein